MQAKSFWQVRGKGEVQEKGWGREPVVTGRGGGGIQNPRSHLWEGRVRFKKCRGSMSNFKKGKGEGFFLSVDRSKKKKI